MDQKTTDMVKEISAGVTIAIVNATPSLGIKLSKNESEVCRANLISWIDVLARENNVDVTFNFGQMLKRPPLYGLACSAVMSSVFKREVLQFLKNTPGLEHYEFSFSHRY